MKHRSGILAMVAASMALALSILPISTSAHSQYFTDRCSECHSNDNETCNGCHHHTGSLTASADRSSYAPGDPVTVTLDGGTQHGWIRAILYDQNHSEIARATGPTGRGDDGQPNPVVFPVSLQGTAPAQAGDYVWQMAWFGNDDGGGHIQLPVDVPIHVVQPEATVPGTWGAVRRLYR